MPSSALLTAAGAQASAEGVVASLWFAHAPGAAGSYEQLVRIIDRIGLRDRVRA